MDLTGLARIECRTATLTKSGPGSSVSVATDYGLDGPR